MTPCAVILAAGRGTRMGELGETHAKALIPVGDAPVVGHHLRMLHKLGIRDVFMVVGYRAADVVAELGDGAGYGVRIRYVEQQAQLGIAHAVGRVRAEIAGPFLLLLGDYFFWADRPERLLARLHAGASAIAVRRESDPRLIAGACEVRTDDRQRVTAIVEKPHRPSGDLKGCGFYALQPAVFDCIAVTPRTALRDEYELSHSLDLLVRAGHHLFAEDVGIWDCNLTVPADILDCNMEWLRRAARRDCVNADAVIEPDTILDRVVVGAGARVSRHARLEEVVVMPGARVREHAVLRRALVTPDATYGPL
jgi:NDP-sugar pyrophosphorylase family protein